MTAVRCALRGTRWTTSSSPSGRAPPRREGARAQVTQRPGRPFYNSVRPRGEYARRIVVRTAPGSTDPVEQLESRGPGRHVALRAPADLPQTQTLGAWKEPDPAAFVRVPLLPGPSAESKDRLYAKNSREATLADGTRVPVSREGRAPRSCSGEARSDCQLEESRNSRRSSWPRILEAAARQAVCSVGPGGCSRHPVRTVIMRARAARRPPTPRARSSTRRRGHPSNVRPRPGRAGRRAGSRWPGLTRPRCMAHRRGRHTMSRRQENGSSGWPRARFAA